MDDTTEGCDGAFWRIIETKTKEYVKSEIATTIYRFDDTSKISPSEDHGFYKYDILMIQKENKKAEIISAYIGDVDFFIKNQAKAGRVGLLIKKGAVKKKLLKKMFNLVLNDMDFPEKSIKTILTEVH